MVTVEFEYQQKRSLIQANFNDTFETISQKFETKVTIKPNTVYYISNGKTLQKNDIIQNVMSAGDKSNNIMKILVMSNTGNDALNNKKAHLTKSKDIICPKCFEPCKIEINNYRIKLYDCKNGHEIENIKYEDFMETQKYDETKILCGNCKKNNKAEAYNNEFFFCIRCNMNLCPLCKSVHDKNHTIMDYGSHNYICIKHNETYFKYCEDCKEDLCLTCESDHENHNLTSYSEILSKIKDIKGEMNNLKKMINIFKDNLKEMIKKMNKIIDNMETYYLITDEILNNFKSKKNRNNFLLFNAEEAYTSVINEIGNIKYSYEFGHNLNSLLYLYNEMQEKNEEIEMTYIPIEDNKEEKLRIFGNSFVYNNIYKCKIIYNNSYYDLIEFFDIDFNYNKKDPFTFTLKGINSITNMSHMFTDCKSISSLPDISNWNTSNVHNMNNLFSFCESLTSLPDISKWNTSNVIEMLGMFCRLTKITFFPDISGWDTSNVTDMTSMFESCESLDSLPDISNWNISNVSYIGGMFQNCKSLSSLPYLDEWKTNNVENMSYIFSGCESLLTMPDISKWNTSKVIYMDGMFNDCIKLLSLPNLSKWNVNKVTSMIFMFSNCESLKSLPDLSKWNISNNTNIDNMFYNCSKSLKIPPKFVK